MFVTLCQNPIARPRITETTALGAAYLAGLAVGFWESDEEIARYWEIDRRFEPQMRAPDVAEARSRWAAALELTKHWERPASS